MSGIPSRLVARSRDAIAGYIFALQLSAGVATTYLSWVPDDAPAPIVRVAGQVDTDGFDNREIAPIAGGVGIITLPMESSLPHGTVGFSKN